MTMTLTAAKLMMDAMAMMYVKTRYAYTGEEPPVDEVELVVRANFVQFCEDNGIDEIADEEEEEEDREPDFSDDVDETNYNPYMGCDDYECYTYEDLGSDWY